MMKLMVSSSTVDCSVRHPFYLPKMEKPENCAGYKFQRLFGRTMFFRNGGVTNKVVRPKTKCKKNSLAGKNNRINKTKEFHYFRTSSFRVHFL